MGWLAVVRYADCDLCGTTVRETIRVTVTGSSLRIPRFHRMKMGEETVDTADLCGSCWEKIHAFVEALATPPKDTNLEVGAGASVAKKREG